MSEKLDLTKPMQTRDGRPVTLLAGDLKSERPLVVRYYLADGSGMECVSNRHADGSVFNDGITRDQDIINVPEKHVRYVNIYPETPYYKSRAEADAMACSHRIACRRVDFEEGQFDE